MDKFFNRLSEAATPATVGFIFSVNVRKRLEKVNKNDKIYTRGPPPILCRGLVGKNSLKIQL
jgi:hypothetical protein